MGVDLRVIEEHVPVPCDAERDARQVDWVPGGACVVASIDNHFQLESAYGSAVALTVRHLVRERARLLCEEEGGLVSGGGARLLLIFDDAASGLPDTDRGRGDTVLLERIIAALGNQGVEFTWGTIFPVISARIARSSASPFDIEDVGDRSNTLMGLGKAWRAQYLSDMATAGEVLAALEDGDLRLHYEPICDARDAGKVLYHEALLRKVINEKCESAGSFIPALERLGLVRRIDQWVMTTAIDALKAHPSVRIGCNVSARSAVVDGWWASILVRLEAEPDLASRLTIEITETAPLSDLAEAGHFVRTFQSLGCQIALDDIGAGYSNIEALIALGPDVAKIDAIYVRRARSVATGQDCLTHLIGLASSCASCVVVEGVENDADLLAAQLSGAAWVQGYRISQLPAQWCLQA